MTAVLGNGRPYSFGGDLPVGTTTHPAPSRRGSAGRFYLWLGIGLVLIGPILYFVQLQLKPQVGS